ncbi:hypothetical protein PTKIN_Ptkin01aG0390500 [Pterospermum kingtungense]
MGCVSTAVAQHERKVLGIIPSAFTVNNLVGETCGKEIKVATMQERLVMMMELSDAFIALPEKTIVDAVHEDAIEDEVEKEHTEKTITDVVEAEGPSNIPGLRKSARVRKEPTWKADYI